MFPSTYYALAYFAARFFARIVPLRNRDRDVFLHMQSLLAGTLAFAAVKLHQSPGNLRATAEQNPVVMLRRMSWTEENRWGAHDTLLRTVAYEAWIVVRDEESDARWESLNMLEALVCNTLGGKCFAGITFPAETWIRAGTDDQSERHPEQRLKLTGQFEYINETYSGHSTDP